MTTSTQNRTITVSKLPKTFGGEFLNAFKTGRGGLLTREPRKPVQLEADDGTWLIVRITSATWLGSARLNADVEVIPPIHMSAGIIPAHMDIDLRSSGDGATITLVKPR